MAFQIYNRGAPVYETVHVQDDTTTTVRVRRSGGFRVTHETVGCRIVRAPTLLEDIRLADAAMREARALGIFPPLENLPVDPPEEPATKNFLSDSVSITSACLFHESLVAICDNTITNMDNGRTSKAS